MFCPLFREGSERVQRGFREGSMRIIPLNPQSTPSEHPIYPLYRVDVSKMKDGQRKKR